MGVLHTDDRFRRKIDEGNSDRATTRGEEAVVEGHPTPQELRAFAEGQLPKARPRSVVTHLLRGCPTCHAEPAALLHLSRIRRGPRAATPERPRAYDDALHRGHGTPRAAHV